MAGWIEGIQASIDYMEAHLEEELRMEDIASMAGLSPFYFQRIFGALCNMTVGEYLRARRMTIAAQALSSGEGKVIDIANRFGYDSPDSFSKAFARFHGVSPSRVKAPGAPLRFLAPLHIKVVLEGGSMLEYRIVELAPFTIMGVHRRFHSETSYQEIPKFWDEYMAQGDEKPVMGMFGVCADLDGGAFDYWIADLYQPWNALGQGCETMVIPGGLWAQFPCRGALPDSLQSVNTKIWSEWLPALRDYTLAGNYSIEAYMPPAEKPEDCINYIWIPLKKV